jgi:spermidine/putrescine-binding protein
MVRPGECSGNGEAGFLSRRQMLRRGAALALTVPSAAALLEACSSSPSSSSGTGSRPASLAGTAHMENYPDWMGTHVVPAFQKLHPSSFIKQTTNSSSSISGTVQQLKTGNFDFGLADVSATQQAVDIGLVQPPDWSKIPNIRYVGQSFRAAYPHGIPTDYGKIGIGYRPDLVGEKITSWHDVWRLAPSSRARSFSLTWTATAWDRP